MKPGQNCIDCAAYDKETGCCMKYATHIPDESGGALASEDCFCKERPRYTLHVLAKGHEVRENKTGKVAYHFPSETFTPWENSERAALGTVEAMNKAAESERRAAIWKRAAKKWWKSECTCWEMSENMADQMTELKEKIRALEDELQDERVLREIAMKWRAHYKEECEKLKGLRVL